MLHRLQSSNSDDSILPLALEEYGPEGSTCITHELDSSANADRSDDLDNRSECAYRVCDSNTNVSNSGLCGPKGRRRAHDVLMCANGMPMRANVVQCVSLGTSGVCHPDPLTAMLAASLSPWVASPQKGIGTLPHNWQSTTS